MRASNEGLSVRQTRIQTAIMPHDAYRTARVVRLRARGGSQARQKVKRDTVRAALVVYVFCKCTSG
jgi:hypothetical protein